MYRARKRVSDYEVHYSQVPVKVIKRDARTSLYRQLMHTFEQEDKNIEDYILRFTSERVEIDGERYTEYELTAVPLADARVLLGRY